MSVTIEGSIGKWGSGQAIHAIINNKISVVNRKISEYLEIILTTINLVIIEVVGYAVYLDIVNWVKGKGNLIT